MHPLTPNIIPRSDSSLQSSQPSKDHATELIKTLLHLQKIQHVLKSDRNGAQVAAVEPIVVLQTDLLHGFIELKEHVDHGDCDFGFEAGDHGVGNGLEEACLEMLHRCVCRKNFLGDDLRSKGIMDMVDMIPEVDLWK